MWCGKLVWSELLQISMGLSWKSRAGSVSSEAGGTLKWREKLRALVEPSDSRASFA